MLHVRATATGSVEEDQEPGPCPLDLSGPVEPSSSHGDTALGLSVEGSIIWDSGPEARAHMVAQGEALRALLGALGDIEVVETVEGDDIGEG